METTAIEDSAVRPLVFSNALLGRLVVCLAASVGATAATRVLNYVSGDGQSAQAGSALANPLVVSLTDGSGNPIPGTIVQFTPAAGSGSVQPASVEAGADGTASANWTLGPQPGPQQVTAAAAGSSFSVTMRATAL